MNKEYNLKKDKWEKLHYKGYKFYFWSRFPFLFVPFSILFFFSEDIMELGFSEWEDLGRLTLFSITPALVVSALILSMRWRFKERQFTKVD
ncbi:hypothetical protein ACQCVP_22765 [Rossellomorea vietnamensis]|uniref:hypothetical protein n=1 Tax=Rossellomorea vietnamensis TaxID=218284 RepID=UPI003CE81AB8